MRELSMLMEGTGIRGQDFQKRTSRGQDFPKRTSQGHQWCHHPPSLKRCKWHSLHQCTSGSLGRAQQVGAGLRTRVPGPCELCWLGHTGTCRGLVQGGVSVCVSVRESNKVCFP